MTQSSIRLGLLDFGWIYPDQSPAEALADVFALAKSAEELGYTRYWIGEHHVEGIVSGSPQIMAALLAVATKRIRIGVGAMLLYYWAPLKLSEDFLLLEALFGRVDLGLGRGRADNPKSHSALLDGRADFSDGMLSDNEYAGKLDDLLGHLRGNLPAAHPHFGAAVIPAVGLIPEIWICGSASAAVQAARTGTRFCCTLFHGRIPPPSHLTKYESEFRPSNELPSPHAAIAMAGVCAETEAEALEMRTSFPLAQYVTTVCGTPEQCKTQIEAFCSRYRVAEVILLDIAPDRKRRLKSAQLLAQAFELKAPTP